MEKLKECEDELKGSKIAAQLERTLKEGAIYLQNRAEEKNKRLTEALQEIQAMTGFEWLPRNKGRSPNDLKINGIATEALKRNNNE